MPSGAATHSGQRTHTHTPSANHHLREGHTPCHAQQQFNATQRCRPQWPARTHTPSAHHPLRQGNSPCQAQQQINGTRRCQPLWPLHSQHPLRQGISPCRQCGSERSSLTGSVVAGWALVGNESLTLEPPDNSRHLLLDPQPPSPYLLRFVHVVRDLIS
jgi:hypothetical protein